MSVKEYAVIWQLVNRIKPKRILEVGTARGFSTRVLHEACPSAIIHSVDCLENLSVEDWGKFVKHIPNVNLIRGNSQQMIPKLCGKYTYELALLDNGHTKEVVCKNVMDTAHIPVVIVHNGLNPEIREAIHECSKQRFIRIDPFPAVDVLDRDYLNRTHWKGLGLWIKYEW